MSILNNQLLGYNVVMTPCIAHFFYIYSGIPRLRDISYRIAKNLGTKHFLLKRLYRYDIFHFHGNNSSLLVIKS
jgi:hypothetical protein